MAGVLEVIVLRSDRPDDAQKLLPGASMVHLTDNFYLIPLTDQAKAAIGGGEACLGFESLTTGVVETATELSHLGSVAYFHVEFHGGIGFHAAIVWGDGEVQFGPLFTANHPDERTTEDYVLVAPQDMAINAALRFMGADAHGYVDEFQAVDLTRHRWTDEWVPT